MTWSQIALNDRWRALHVCFADIDTSATWAGIHDYFGFSDPSEDFTEINIIRLFWHFHHAKP